MILLPLPKKMEEKEGTLLLSLDAMIVMDGSCPADAAVYAGLLQEEIAADAGFQPGIVKGSHRVGDILLQIVEALDEQEYCLKIEAEGIVLQGGSLNALGWAVQTLRQIVRQCGGLLPFLSIEDRPDFENRGFYHDVTRGRVQTLPNLKKLVDTLAFYKMNQLQLYVEHTYLFRGMTELWRNETPLTAQEIMELDTYCYERGVELVPSLSSFGHLCQLLSSKSHAHLCELEDSTGKSFSFRARMEHHTINVSHPGSLELIKGMIGEYMQLFRTDKFNICADETFDLGKGKNKALAEEKGASRLYVDYIKELFAYLIGKGKTPMFWGDILCRHPELFAELPSQVICLNWGYAPDQREDETRAIAGTGALQYVCPGACGWNTWVNVLNNSYRNISKMVGYGKKYHAIGVLNTDWGDFGHINHPVYSVPGLIYGAAASWSGELPEYEELNRQISVLEFGDRSGNLLALIGRITDEMVFSWAHVVTVKEWAQEGRDRKLIEDFFREENMDRVPECNERLAEAERELSLIGRSLDSSRRGILGITRLSIRLVRIWNEVGSYLAQEERTPEQGSRLAGELEQSLYQYKAVWRENSKEGNLQNIADIFCWYADLLRQ